MADTLFCISCPALPGLVRVGGTDRDPLVAAARLAGRGGRRGHRVEWTLKVADAEAAEAALLDALSPYADSAFPDQFRCDPLRARAMAIRFATLREWAPKAEEAAVSAGPDTLPSCVLALGLGVQFLHMSQGASGPSFALVAAALFVATYTWNGLRRRHATV